MLISIIWCLNGSLRMCEGWVCFFYRINIDPNVVRLNDLLPNFRYIFHHVSFIYYSKLGTPQFKYWHSHGLVYLIYARIYVLLYAIVNRKMKILEWMYRNVCYEYTIMITIITKCINTFTYKTNTHKITQNSPIDETIYTILLYLCYVRFDAL